MTIIRYFMLLIKNKLLYKCDYRKHEFVNFKLSKDGQKYVVFKRILISNFNCFMTKF